MSYITNSVESHIVLNVERIDLNERLQFGEFESATLENNLHGIVTEGFEHLKGLNHTNVCKYTNMLRIEGNSYLFVSEGYSLTLNKMLTSSSEEFLKINFTNVVNQIICGLQYLHSSGFSHGRLTLDCISISDEGFVKIGGYISNYVNRIVDYLCSKKPKDDKDEEVLEENQVRKNYLMDGFGFHDDGDFIECVKKSSFLYNLMFYMPPEVVFYDEKVASSSIFWYNVDIWSLGICILIIMSYIISRSEFAREADNKNHGDGDSKIGGKGSLYLEKKCRKVTLGFERLKNMFNVKVEESSRVVEPYLFVLYLIVLINKMEGNSKLSTLGLDMCKIIESKFKFLSDESESDRIKLVTEIFESVYDKMFNNKTNDEGESNDQKEVVIVNGSVSEQGKVISCNEVISTAIELLTAEDVLKNVIKINQKSENLTEECRSFVENVNYMLSIANECLIIGNTQRPSALDLCSRYNVLKLTQKGVNGHEEEQVGYSWFTYKEKYEYMSGEESFTQPYSVESFRECQTNLSESKFFLNQVGLDNVLYYWTLLGNEINSIIPFQMVKRVDSDTEELRVRNLSYMRLEYFKRYKVGRVFLGELVKHVKLANLFPMIIEHQLRPSCVYARQQCFIYQLLRIRRFTRLLNNAVDNTRQIYVEAMIDIPPLLRSRIWCNLLEVIHRPATKACPLSTGYEFGRIPPELEQNLNFYNNDLLYSTNNLNKLLCSVEDLKRKIIHQQLPSSIYSFTIPLMLLYHDSRVYNIVLEKIFCKYLKDFYSPTGSFVNNYLSEFSTILNFFDPEISHHLRSIGAYADSYALPWFMSLFSENTSVDQVYLIWDALLVQPKQYIKFLAVMIVHNVRERLLSITDARVAISFISCVIDSLNVPMLVYLTRHIYTLWCEVLSSKASAHKSGPLDEWLDQNNNFRQSNPHKADADSCNLDRSTFIFVSDEYPFERCFKLSIETFSKVFKDCVIIDLRSVESYNLGHIPNSIHINKLLSALSETDKKTNPISIPIFNEKSTFGTNMDFKASSVQTPPLSILNSLRNNSQKAWLHENSAESNKIVLVAGDGYDEETEMFHLRRLVFEFKLQHVCYYRINTEEWPKVLTLSKI